MIVFCYVERVIIINEIAVIDQPEYYQGSNSQKNVNHEHLLILWHRIYRCFRWDIELSVVSLSAVDSLPSIRLMRARGR
jgi:hypothetical protein